MPSFNRVQTLCLCGVIVAATSCASPVERVDPAGEIDVAQQALGTLAFDPSCDASKQDTLFRAQADAHQLALDAFNEFEANPFSERARRWFGDVDSSSYFTILSIQAGIISTLENNAFAFDCSPKERRGYAQEINADAQRPLPTIRFWPAFFATPPGGYTDAEVLLHEVGHYVGTDTYDDGCDTYEAAHDLAQSSSSRAALCSYNHQFFAVDAQVAPAAPVCVD